MVYKKCVKILVLYKEDNQIFMLELIRATSQSFAGSSDVPGGKIELDELPLEAAIRELNEETGIQVSELCYVGLNSFVCNNKEYEQHYYYTYVPHKQVIINAEEHSSFGWIPLEELEKTTLFDETKKYFMNVIKREFEIN